MRRNTTSKVDQCVPFSIRYRIKQANPGVPPSPIRGNKILPQGFGSSKVRLGHEDPFPRPGPNGWCRFAQETFAGVRGNGRDAPIAAVRGTAIETDRVSVSVIRAALVVLVDTTWWAVGFTV